MHATRHTELGDHVHFNGMWASGDGRLVIGDWFHSGDGLRIFTRNHNYDKGDAIPYDRTYIKKDVVIGDFVWIGAQVILLPGTTIGEGAIIGMRSTERDIEAEADRMSSLMGLDPAGFGEPAQAGLAASHRDATMGTSYGTMNVTVNVNAGSAPEARAAGTNLAEALYEELSRKMGSSLWPVSYSTA